MTAYPNIDPSNSYDKCFRTTAVFYCLSSNACNAAETNEQKKPPYRTTWRRCECCPEWWRHARPAGALRWRARSCWGHQGPRSPLLRSLLRWQTLAAGRAGGLGSRRQCQSTGTVTACAGKTRRPGETAGRDSNTVWRISLYFWAHNQQR